MTADTELLIIAAAGRGEFTVDDNHVHWFRWNGVPVEYDLYAKVHNLAHDGLLDVPDADGAVVSVTGRGANELRQAGIR